MMGGVSGKSVWEHTIRDEQNYRNHMDYVHLNPVKHGLVAHPAAWPCSKFQKCVALGLYNPARAAPDNATMSSGTGERS